MTIREEENRSVQQSIDGITATVKAHIQSQEELIKALERMNKSLAEHCDRLEKALAEERSVPA